MDEPGQRSGYRVDSPKASLKAALKASPKASLQAAGLAALLALMACGGGGGGGSDGGAAPGGTSGTSGTNGTGGVDGGSGGDDGAPSGGGSALAPPDGGTTADPGGSPDAARPDEGAATGSHSLRLTWSRPTTRADGSPLAADEIQGYVVVFFGLRDGDAGRGWLDGRLPSLEVFQRQGGQLSAFIDGHALADMVTAGSPHAIVVSPGNLPYELEGLPADTYYVAVSCFDWAGRYGALSNTERAVRR